MEINKAHKHMAKEINNSLVSIRDELVHLDSLMTSSRFIVTFSDSHDPVFPRQLAFDASNLPPPYFVQMRTSLYIISLCISNYCSNHSSIIVNYNSVMVQVKVLSFFAIVSFWIWKTMSSSVTVGLVMGFKETVVIFAIVFSSSSTSSLFFWSCFWP